jgi:4-carboxymuconolactone decarboxylase
MGLDPATGEHVSEREERGKARQAEMSYGPTASVQYANPMERVAPDLVQLITEFAYGDIHSRPGLDAAKRQLVILGVLTALGDTERQVANHTKSALGAGLSAHEIVEAIYQTIPYVGFPRAIRALTAVAGVLEEHDLVKSLPWNASNEQHESNEASESR